MDEELTEVEETEVENTETVVTDVPSDLPSEVRKHMERQSRRIEKLQRQLAQSELKSQHGDQIAAAVAASGLPPEKWGEYAGTLKGLIPGDTTTPTEQASEPEVEETPSPQEANLAAAGKGSEGNAASGSGFKPDELLEIAKRNPDEYLRLKKAGAELERLPGNMT